MGASHRTPLTDPTTQRGQRFDGCGWWATAAVLVSCTEPDGITTAACDVVFVPFSALRGTGPAPVLPVALLISMPSFIQGQNGVVRRHVPRSSFSIYT
jgi:hypothetical protein